MAKIAKATFIMNNWGFGMVFPVGTLCTHCTSIWSSRNERKMLLWKINVALGINFFWESGSVCLVALACTCEICIIFCWGCGPDGPRLSCAWCSLVLCPLAPSWSHLPITPAGCAAPQGCLSLGQGQLCGWQCHVLGSTCNPAVTSQFL